MNTFAAHKNTKATILVIETNTSELKLISETLDEAGYFVEVEDNIEAALKSVESKPPDLILLNIDLLDQKDIDLSQCLKRSHSTNDIPVILINSNEDIESKVQAFKVGGVDYITKPIDGLELLARTKTQLSISNLRCILETNAEELIVAVNERKRVEEKHKNTEHALRESEEKFKAISSSANEAIIMINDKGNITFWNKSSCEIFGSTEREVLGKNFHDLFVPRKYHEKHHKAFRAFRETGDGPAIGNTIELSAYRKDGTEFPIELSLSSVKLSNAWHAIGIVRDITKRKHDEEEMQKLSFAIDQSVNTVVITDLDGNIEYVNPKFTEVTGYSAKEAIGQNPRLLKSGEMSTIAYRDLWCAIASGESWSGEFHNKKKNGELYWEKTTISPITDKSGSIISYLAIKEDVSEQKARGESRKILEIEVNQARKLESVGSLAAGIAHEINTPIQFVGDNTNFLSDSFKALMVLLDSFDAIWQEAKTGKDIEILDSQRVEAAQNADVKYLKEEVPAAIAQTLDGVKRVTKIVRAMKDFAHSDHGEMTHNSINDMLGSTLTVAQNELKYVADVETNFDSELPEVECFRDELNQVFLNLLVNAAHTIADVVGDSPSTKGTITIFTERDNDNVLIKISDTGKGIPQSIQDRVFDPFFTTKDVGKGSGQGLSIARRIIVEKHAGRLDFETEEGKGTTFMIRLPISSPETVKTPDRTVGEGRVLSK